MKKAKIIVLAGQSNAVGVGYTKYLSKHFDEETVAKFYVGYENVQINYYSHGIKSNGFVRTTVNCTEAEKDTCGPELGIAKNLTKRYPNEEFFIVKCAFGGATLFNDWLSPSNGLPYSASSLADEYPDIVQALNQGKHPTAGWCYNELIILLHNSIEMLEKAGYEPQICAFFWMQGESDSYAKELVGNYISRYDNLLKDFKNAFSAYISDCIYVDAGISEEWLYYKELNAKKCEYAKQNGYCYLDTVGAGLTTTNEPLENPDTAHYDTDSIIKLGEMFAKNIILKD